MPLPTQSINGPPCSAHEIWKARQGNVAFGLVNLGGSFYLPSLEPREDDGISKDIDAEQQRALFPGQYEFQHEQPGQHCEAAALRVAQVGVDQSFDAPSRQKQNAEI